MMKFMLPNYFGIYLHDFPERTISPRTSCGSATAACGSRITSASRPGCSADTCRRAGSEVEEEVDLPKPVPVYMTYLTAQPTAKGCNSCRSLRSRRPFDGAVRHALTAAVRGLRSECIVWLPRLARIGDACLSPIPVSLLELGAFSGVRPRFLGILAPGDFATNGGEPSKARQAVSARNCHSKHRHRPRRLRPR